MRAFRATRNRCLVASLRRAIVYELARLRTRGQRQQHAARSSRLTLLLCFGVWRLSARFICRSLVRHFPLCLVLPRCRFVDLYVTNYLFAICAFQAFVYGAPYSRRHGVTLWRGARALRARVFARLSADMILKRAVDVF